MMSELIPIPKTKAGQYYKLGDITVIRERLTSYGSQAIVKRATCYVVIMWDNEALSYILSDCDNNFSFAQKLWEEIV